MDHRLTNLRCRGCNSILTLTADYEPDDSDPESNNYPYECLECDENFYGFEAKKENQYD